MVIAAFAVASCKRAEHSAPPQLGIAPIENLTGDPALNWAGPAVSSIVSSSARIVTVARAADAAGAGVSQLLQGYFTAEQGQLRFHLALFDLGSQRNVRELDASGPVEEVVAVAGRLSAQLAAHPAPFATRNVEAVRAWGASLVATDPAEKAAALDRAITADPGFGPAYCELVALDGSQGKIAEAIVVLDLARPVLDKFAPADRHRLELQDAELRGDAASRQKALSVLVSDNPGNLELLKRLAATAEMARDWKAAADALRKAAKLAPEDPTVANLLGYVEAYSGNFAEAKASLERYAALRPDEANPDDSLGEVCFYFGKFAEAEQYFLKASRRGPGGKMPFEIQKAALTRLMRGDVPGADALMAEIAPVANPAARAGWLAVSGRMPEAIAIMRTLATKPESAGLAEASLAVWLALQRKGEEARVIADHCLSRPREPLAPMCALVSTRQLQVPPVMQEQIGAYHLLLDGRFAEALPVWKKRYEQTQPGTDTTARLVYAWALVETGHAAEAAPLLMSYPVVLPGDGPMLAPMLFPRYLRLRSAALRAVGKQADAAAADELYRKLTGGGA